MPHAVGVISRIALVYQAQKPDLPPVERWPPKQNNKQNETSFTHNSNKQVTINSRPDSPVTRRR